MFKSKKNNKPFVIAEMSGNHNQSLERALQLVDVAVQAGVDAIKLQTYTADTITMKNVHVIDDKDSIWYGRELYDLYKEAHTPWEWHSAIFERAKKGGILCFSSPFDETAVDFLENLSCPIYKIASFENTHHPLLKKVAQTKKPVIMSTGVSTLSEVIESVHILEENGATDITLLKCTSSYPASAENANLLTIPLLQQLFPTCKIGISDHTMGVGVSIAAVALGAAVIEKHLTISRDDGGVDSSFSMEPQEMSLLVKEAGKAANSLGYAQFNVQKKESDNLKYKRSIFVSKPIKKGEQFSIDNIKVIRPGYGLAPKYFEDILSKKSSKDLDQGSALGWEMVIN